MPLLLILISLFGSEPASAYPEFIGYKYASCITCHYNGQGNGPLNDYGRALWAAEIAGRAFSGGRTDEQLGEASGAFGSKQLPYWIRPGFKARNLMYQTSPGGGGESRVILMQAEANLALIFDQDQKHMVVGSFGHAPIPQRFANAPGQPEIDEWISREHYYRWQKSDSLFLYFGMTDKVFGTRIVNHTAYSRSRTGNAMNDQVHGIVAQYYQPKYEITGHAFAGNLYQDADLRQMGGSVMYEYEPAESWRVGGSLLHSSNEYVTNQRTEVHTRRGFGHGSAVLFELGLIRNAPKAGDATLGYYIFSEAIQRMIRGYHLFVSGQVYKDRMEKGRPENLRVSVGALVFPLQRFEFRLEVENSRQLNTSPDVADDVWTAMGQIHVSL